MNLANMGATVTGPMRIVSDGVGGTIAGRLQVNRARWQLGVAAHDAGAAEHPHARDQPAARHPPGSRGRGRRGAT